MICPRCNGEKRIHQLGGGSEPCETCNETGEVADSEGREIVVSYQVDGFVNQRITLTEGFSHLTNDEILQGLADGSMWIAKQGDLMLQTQSMGNLVIGTNDGTDEKVTRQDFTIQNG